jgi:hypothetical protein
VRRSAWHLARHSVALSIAFVVVALAALVAGRLDTAQAATYNTWTAQSSGTTQTLQGIDFPNGLSGWTVAANGTIRATTNGGTTWAGQTSGTNVALNGVSFFDSNDGWVVGGHYGIAYTSDGGTTWVAQSFGNRKQQIFYAAACSSATNAWAVGSSGMIYHTVDAATWTTQTSGTGQALQGVAFIDANNGWAVGNSGVIRHTTNGGATWTGQTSGTTQALYGVTFVDANNGWVVGAAGVVLHTTNGGATWTAQTSGVTVALYEVAAESASTAWMVGASGSIRATTNGGATWSAQTSGTTQQLRGIHYAAGKLWAAGGSGTILTSLVDSTPPATTATGLQAGAATGWITTSQSVTLAATDAQSGVAATFYTIDGGGAQTYGAPFIVSGEGSHVVTYWSRDAGGNGEATHTGYVNIDATAPTTTASGLQATDHTGWRATSQSVTFAAGDGSGSGVAITYYSLDGVPQIYAGTPVVVSGNGSHIITYYSADVAGNAEATQTGYVNIDTVAPTTTATGLQANGSSGWRNSGQTVTLAATDGAGCGVATTSYRIDGGAVQPYGGAFTVAGQGSHTITYWSVDTVGNTEGVKTGYVNIDTTAPTVSDDADANWHGSAVTVHLSPLDTGGSGLSGTQYRAQGSFTWLAAAGSAFVVPAPADGSNDGARVYQYRALDVAGNSSVVRSCTLWIDTQAAVTTSTGLAADAHAGWRTTSQDVTLAADDGMGSGVSAIRYTVDGGGTVVYSGVFTVSGQGSHAVTYWSTDVAGNVEATRTGYVNISDPYAQASGLAADDHSGWRTADAPVTITTDGGHKPLTIHYRIDGGGWQTASVSASFTIAGEGSHLVEYFAENTLGTQSATQSGYANIDATLPTTLATGLQANDHTGWQITPPLVTLTGSDALSGVAATLYTIDGGSAQTYTGAPIVIATDGSHLVTYWSVDAAGNTEAAHTSYVNIDASAPVTSATGLQATDHTGWRTTSQPVTLSPVDSLSGVAATHYTIDGGGTQTHSSAFSVSGQGSHTVTYWSVDALGNSESVQTGYVNIDTTAPVTIATGLQVTNHTGWRTTSQDVSLSAIDGVLSGVTATSYTVDGGAPQAYSAPFSVSGAGSHAITYWSVDVAGNTESTHTGYVNIDVTAPVTGATGLQVDDHSGWRKIAQTVTLTPGDDLAGVTKTYYTVDGGSAQTYSASFSVSAEGSHTLTYWSVDAAGNTESTHTGYVNIDVTAPTTTATGLQADASSGWRNTGQTVTLSPSDNLSGVSVTRYTVDGGAAQTYSGGFAVASAGSHTIAYWSVDVAGNTESAHTGYVNIDTALPTVTSNADSAWHNSAVTVQFSPADTGGSGAAATEYRLQGSPTWLATSGDAFTVPAPPDGSGDGTFTFEYHALDGAGNASTTRTCTVKIDTQGPATTATGLQPDDISGWRTTSQSVTLAAADGAGSGLAAIRYTVDGGGTQVYTGAFIVSGDGQHPVVYWSTDAIGNVEVAHTGYVNIGTVFAQDAGLAADATSSWRTTSATVTIAGGGSLPPFTIHYRADGGVWRTAASPASFTVSGAGSHTVDYYASNSTSINSIQQTGYVNIDATAPTTTSSGLQGNATSGWIATSQAVSFTPTDALSGVATTYYTVDGGSAQNYTGSPITVSGNGSHPVTYWSVDNAGNSEGAHTGYVNIDISGPTTTATGLSADDHSGWTTVTRTVTLAAVDTLSGVAGAFYTVDGGDETDYTGSFTISGDGQHQVVYWSTDNLGNVETAKIGYVNIDATAPTTTAAGLQVNNHSGWQSTSQLVTLTGDDSSGSGVVTTRYTIDGGASQLYAAGFTVSGAGSHPITYWSVDAAGNTEGAKTGYVNIDATPPTVTDNYDGAWHKTAVTVVLSPIDGGSGIASTECRAQGSPTWLATSGNTFGVPAPADGSGDGLHAFEYRALDNAGNPSSTGTCTVKIDTQGPVTTTGDLQANNYSGWRNTGKTVTLTPADGSGSGVSVTRYTVDGAGTQTYSSPFSVSTAGAHTIVYWSVDLAANTESSHTGYVNIDLTLPTVTDNADSAWHNSAVTVQLSPADTGGSGVAATEYRLQGSPTWLATMGDAFSVPAPADGSGDGAFVYEYHALDHAGNASTTHTCTVKIDTQAPVTTTADLQPDNHSGWRTTSKTVTLTSADAGAGVSVTYYTFDGGARQTYAGPFSVSGSGAHRVTYWSVDAIGNVEGPATGYVNIDASAPSTASTGLIASALGPWQNAGAAITLTASDALSGVAVTHYAVDGGGTQDYTGAFAVTADGAHVITYWSVDNVGNIEPTKTGYVKIDTTPPTTAATGLQPDDQSGWRTANQVVSLAPGDGSGSGVTATTYTLEGGAPQAYTVPFTVSGTGQHVVTYWSSDAAGNTENTKTGYVNISDPYAQASGLATSDHSGWRTTDAAVSISGGGDFGPFVIHYRVDGGAWQAVADPAGFVVSGEGNHSIEYYATNSALQEGFHQTGYVNIDATAPVTTATGLQADATSGWRNTAQAVTLASNDNLSGVAVTRYTVDGGAPQTYSSPFSVSTAGSHTITYWSVDAAGNTESAHTGYINIDLTVPTVSDDGDSAWHNSAVTVRLSPADTGGSGVAGTEYRLQGSGSWLATTGDAFTVPAPADGSGDGAFTFEYHALDHAGNASTSNTCTVKIDTQGPAVSTDADSYWHNSAVTVHLSATDAGSGAQQLAYRLQGAATWTTVAGAGTDVVVPAPIDGLPHSYVYEYAATDAIGNVTATATFTVRMDTRMPNTTVIGMPTKTWTNKSVSLTFTGTPGDGAPIARTEYSLDGGTTWLTFTPGTPLLFSTPGVASLLYRSVNTAGTVEDPARLATIRIDKGRPTTLALKNVTVLRGRIAKFSYKITDPAPTCGYANATIMIYKNARMVKRIVMTKAAVNKSLVVSSRIKLAKGTYTWKVRATDLAGNVQVKIGAKKLYVK